MSRKLKVETVLNLKLPQGVVTVVFPHGLSVYQTFQVTEELQGCRDFLALAAAVRVWEIRTHQTVRIQVPPAKSILRRAA